ncbi:MAG: alpha/beta hydrolase, partial [Gemmatimonadetes bacterium]|nr:alpha/beta hydrolase [Gemmatimonadota bacterium]
HALLTVLDVPPPYILVGHSWGGPLIRFFAGAHPAGIRGMVYLDPTDMEATAAETMVASNEEELEQRQAELDAVRNRRNLPEGRRAEIRVTTAFLRTPPVDRGLPDDPDVPTLMILGTLIPGIAADAPFYVDEGWFEGLFAGRIERFTEWSNDRPDRTLLVWPDAGHFVHRDQPERTLEAVRRLVERASARR